MEKDSVVWDLESGRMRTDVDQSASSGLESLDSVWA